MESFIVRDQILIRIPDTDLRGVPLKHHQAGRRARRTVVLVPIDFNVGDYITRGDPYEPTHITTGRLLRKGVVMRSEAAVTGHT